MTNKLLKGFNVVIQTSALDTGAFSQTTKGADTKILNRVTNQLSPKDPLLHTSIYEPENKTHKKGWFLNRVTSGDLEMNQLEIRAVQNFHAGSLPRRGTLICCYFVLLAIMAFVLWK